MQSHLNSKNVVKSLVSVVFAGVTLSAAGQTRTYTLDADFDEGTLINVVHDPSDQLQLDDTVDAFNFIWVAVSSQGTVVKINTLTGAVLGEYRTTPVNQGAGNPSRTTVDQDGSVWVGNRNNVSNGFGTVIHIGLEENGQCEDRHDGAGGGPDGMIQTSTGLGDVRGWANASGTRGVATALDECIVHYTQVNSRGTRHVSVDANNDVWVGGLSTRNFDLLKGGRFDVVSSGTIIRSESAVGFGGYGGLIDGNGVIWSARNLLRWDVANPLTGVNGDPAGNDIGPPNAGTNWSGQTAFDSYGLCIDSLGNVWNTQLSGDRINKYAPDGTHLGSFPHGAGAGRAQGCVVDGNDHVWTAHSLDANRRTIGHLLNDGTFVGNVVLSDADVGPTGVAVDAAGKIWATGFRSNKVYRIDPTLGAVGGGGATIGAEDFASVNLGGNLYNYSDMTGSTLTGAPDNGTWTIIHDCDIVDFEWGIVSWTSAEPGDSSITVTAASSNDGVIFGPAENVTNGVDLTVANGQFLRVVVSFARATNLDSDGNGVNDSPILFDLAIECRCELGPTCDGPICKHVTYRTADGDCMVEVGEKVDFKTTIEVVNDTDVFWDKVVIGDCFFRDVVVTNVHTQQGGVQEFQAGNGKSCLRWRPGDLGPGDSATLVIDAETGVDRRGRPEYTRCSNHQFNNGALLRFADPHNQAFRTGPIVISVLTPNAEGDCDGDGFTDQEELNAGTDPHDPDDFPIEPK